MALSKENILEAIANPKSKSLIAKALSNEQRVRFHTEEAICYDDASAYKGSYLEWVKSLLPEDKYNAFCKYLQFPVYTNELTKAVSDEYARVYEAHNRSLTYEFSNSSTAADFDSYLSSIDFFDKWRVNSFNALMRNHNSLIVIDLPTEATTDKATPYFFFLPIEQVIDVVVDKLGNIDYLIYKNEQKVYYMDALKYVVYNVDESNNYTFLLEAPHEIGYTPATFFWSDNLQSSNSIVKRSPFTSSLTNLDWLLYFETSRKMAENYAAFPVLVSYKEKCNYYEEKDGKRYDCRGGIIDRGEFGRVNCPVCEKGKTIGPGTHFKVPAPKSKDEPNNIDAIRFVGAEVSSLQNLESRLVSLWDEIYYDLVGYGGDEQKQAINKDQVRAGFESKQNILNKLKQQLEIAHTFVVSTMAKFRYGTSFIKANIFYGNEFYIKSAEEVLEQYRQAKTSGVPLYFLQHQRNKAETLTTKGNDADELRLRILKHLEPFSDLSLPEVVNLGFKDLFPVEFMIKARFGDWIMKFENEYGSIIEFGSKIEFKDKIETINQILISYVNNTKQDVRQQGQ